MKFPNDSKNGDFLDPKTPDFIDGVLTDFVRNFFGMAHLDMVNLKDIQSGSEDPNKYKQSGFSPREAISAISKNDNLVQRQFLVPTHYSNNRDLNKGDLDPRSELVNPSKRFEASPEARELFQEPTSLFDIFLSQNSPFSIFREIPTFETIKGDCDTLFEVLEGKDIPGKGTSRASSWSSSTSISIFTSPDGITTTRKTVRRSDGSEEYTETITHPTGTLPQREEGSRSSTATTLNTLDESNSFKLFDSVSKWWHNFLS